MHDDTKTDVQSAIDAGYMLQLGGPNDGTVREFGVLPKSAQIVDLEQFHDAPRRIRQRVEFIDEASFCAYLQKYQQTDITAIFCSPEDLTYTAVIDYHVAPDQPQWCQHVATLRLKPSDEWVRWQGKDRQAMSQQDFAEWIEAHYRQFHKPSSAEMLEIALNIQIKKDVNFSSGMRMQSGALQFVYNEVVGASSRAGEIEVPSTFTIFVAPIHGGQSKLVEARLRYRLKESKLTLWYELIDANQVMEKAMAETTAQINSALDIAIYNGTAQTGGPR